MPPKSRTSPTRGITDPVMVPQQAREPFTATAGGSGADFGPAVLRPLSFTVTMPHPDDYYLVRNDQLESLTEGTKNYSLEIALASGGIAAGLLQNVRDVLAEWASSRTPRTFDLVLAAICIGLTVLAITKFCQYRSQASEKSGLKDRIKSGQKVHVQDAH